DWTWNPGAGASSDRTSRCRFLSLCTEPNVCRILLRMDWAMDRLRARQCDGHNYGGASNSRGPFVCGVLRRAYAQTEVWRRVSSVLQERESLGAAPQRLANPSNFRELYCSVR